MHWVTMCLLVVGMCVYFVKLGAQNSSEYLGMCLLVVGMCVYFVKLGA